MSQSTAEDLPRLPRRTEQAVAQIDAARAEPTSAEIEVEMQDAQDFSDVKRTTSGCKACDAISYETDNGKAVILRGPQLAAYRQLEAAAVDAHDAQQSMTTTGVALREAIQAMCAALTGAK